MRDEGPASFDCVPEEAFLESRIEHLSPEQTFHGARTEIPIEAARSPATSTDVSQDVDEAEAIVSTPPPSMVREVRP